jgi:hypothetical protein
MAIKDTEKFLKEMIDFIGREYKRGALDKFSTIVTFTAGGLKQGFKEGYGDIMRKDPSLPTITDSQFLDAGSDAIEAIALWADRPRTMGTTIEHIPNMLVTFRVSRDVKSVYTLAKNTGVKSIQETLKSLGARKLTGANREKGISPRGSEVGILKSGVHRAHQGVTTVGAAQISGGLKFLAQTRSFAGFAKSKEASEISDIISNISGTYETTGTKSGTKPSTVSLKEDIDVGILMLPRSKNPAGAEDYDLNKLWPKVEKAVRAYIVKQNIEEMPGSLSIKDNAVEITTYMVMKELSKSKNAKVVGTLIKPKGRKAKSVDKEKKQKNKKLTGSTKKGRALPNRRVKKGAASNPLHLIGLINKELPQTVLKNMGAPGLVNRTGTFARSAEITDIVQTPQGFPSIGYTYDRKPYGVFEDGDGAAPWANGQRDPRKIIDRSIREIAAQFAIGRFYTRRQ